MRLAVSAFWRKEHIGIAPKEVSKIRQFDARRQSELARSLVQACHCHARGEFTLMRRANFDPLSHVTANVELNSWLMDSERNDPMLY
jgi:hypothetical protein